MVYDYEEDVWLWEKKHGKVKFTQHVIERTGYKKNAITKTEEEIEQDEG